MTGLFVALAVAVVVLLIALATAALLAWAYATAHRDTLVDLAESRRDLRTAQRVERQLRAELSVLRRLAERHAVASAALTPDALTPDWWSTAADIAALPTCDDPGGAR
ncbi:hypothetical protein E1193_11760 [Micromonospora sp. KC606]|uniref:hypothetical protein n=1 Tax=Micromonospora sp. KC606 TaxID=2530379 RepID=UPI0010436C0D|nr:hypothetical protein [Micromonospora sp. KC606]TDC82419.1 hypothetical protein E1193_11760 [Micromonospora sp. KC606]